jgi:SpoVK/Ycf46/Vps4 family AAA+-type ATPase
MNAYICLPKQMYSGIDVNKFKKVFHQNLDKYFLYYDLDVYSKNNINKPQVIFMGEPKLESYKNNIIDTIVTLFRACFKDNSLDVEVKLNYQKYNPNYKTDIINIPQNNDSNIKSYEGSSEFDYDKLSFNYKAIEPKYTFDQVVLPDEVVESINNAIGVINVEHKVFDEWGLREIIPEIGTALNFYGAPGTGKSMTAEAVANKIGKKIIKATYADIESKYHGEGPKMVKAIFKAAEREDAVLFIDESDSLLSKRLTNVTDGSAQAINSMRSQLLISLENHKGLVIFASNLVINYDKAFLSRLINIEFTSPTEKERIKIWNNHLKGKNIKVPLSNDVDINELAKKYEFCGREIKNSIKDACVEAALNNQEFVNQSNFIYACNKTLNEKNKLLKAQDHTKVETIKLDDDKKSIIKESLQRKL